MGAYAVLDGLATALSAIDGVVSCKVGLERSIAPDDYPLIRIVPEKLNGASVVGSSRRKLDLMIYFGMRVDEASDGLPAVYAALLTLEQAIVTVVEAGGSWGYGIHRETVTDEDRLETYKIMAARFEVEG